VLICRQRFDEIPYSRANVIRKREKLKELMEVAVDSEETAWAHGLEVDSAIDDHGIRRSDSAKGRWLRSLHRVHLCNVGRRKRSDVVRAQCLIVTLQLFTHT